MQNSNELLSLSLFSVIISSWSIFVDCAIGSTFSIISINVIIFVLCAGRIVKIKELELVLEINEKDIIELINDMNKEYKDIARGIEIIRVDDGYQMCTKKEYYEKTLYFLP